MTRHLPSYRRGRGEDGVALVWALAFLVLVGVVVFYVLAFVSTSTRATNLLAGQRSAVYNVDGAVNNAIRYVQNDGTLSRGALSGQPCNFSSSGTNGINNFDTSVSCQPIPGSGVPLGTSSAPGFAILTMAPYHGQAPSSGCVNVNNELGIVQVQNSKLLQVTGNVYVNSDADSDIWSGGCPQTSTAEHIKVTGNVRQAESCHDIDVVQPVPAVTPAYTIVCGSAFQNAAVGSFPAAADPASTDPASWAPNISAAPPTQAVPACPPTGFLVTFQPGTYTDATGLTNLMNGTTCPGRLFWFAPGNYYFNFGNNAGAWTINDAAARVVGGAANAVPTGATPIGPVTLAATASPAPTTSAPGFTNPNNALVIGETPTALSATTGTFNTTNQVRWLTTGGYAISPQIPGGASALTINARIVHSETFGTPTQVASLQLLVRNQADTATLCTLTVPPSATSGTSTDVSIALPANCLDAIALNNGAFSLRYQVTHGACGGGGGQPVCANITSTLDGVQLLVSYTAPARASWDPTNASTVTATSPSVPGACVHDGDYGFNQNSGVQFVFGGNSHVNLKAGSWELCDSFSSTHQEIVMYGVRSSSSGTQVGPVTWTPQNFTNGANPFTSPANGRIVDGSVATASLTSGTPTRTMALTQFSPSTWPIPGANQIPAGSTINSVVLSVTHNESNTSQTAAPTVNVTPSGAGACGASALPEHTGLTSDTVDVTACLNTPDKLNGGASVLFTASRSSGSPTESLDGMTLSVTYTPPAVVGSLNGETGCVTQAPYYSPQDHSPAYNGACALFSVASNANGGHSPRVAAFWGTVYAPSAALDVPVDVLTVPVFNRGVVARTLMLGYNLAANATVPITTTPITANAPANRRVIFTATVPGKTTKLVADVEFCDSACDATHGAGTTKIWSWTVSR